MGIDTCTEALSLSSRISITCISIIGPCNSMNDQGYQLYMGPLSTSSLDHTQTGYWPSSNKSADFGLVTEGSRYITRYVNAGSWNCNLIYYRQCPHSVDVLPSSIRTLVDRTRELGMYEIDRPARWPRRQFNVSGRKSFRSLFFYWGVRFPFPEQGSDL